MSLGLLAGSTLRLPGWAVLPGFGRGFSGRLLRRLSGGLPALTLGGSGRALLLRLGWAASWGSLPFFSRSLSRHVFRLLAGRGTPWAASGADSIHLGGVGPDFRLPLRRRFLFVRIHGVFLLRGYRFPASSSTMSQMRWVESRRTMLRRVLLIFSRRSLSASRD